MPRGVANTPNRARVIAGRPLSPNPATAYNRRELESGRRDGAVVAYRVVADADVPMSVSRTRPTVQAVNS
jgi:hypothetical protein